MCPFFDPNCILLHTQLEHAEIYNNLDNNIPTHTRTYTHIRPGPGVEACDAAWPGRARRGGCGQLLRRAAETPEHLAHAHTCASITNRLGKTVSMHAHKQTHTGMHGHTHTHDTTDMTQHDTTRHDTT